MVMDIVYFMVSLISQVKFDVYIWTFNINVIQTEEKQMLVWFICYDLVFSYETKHSKCILFG